MLIFHSDPLICDSLSAPNNSPKPHRVSLSLGKWLLRDMESFVPTCLVHVLVNDEVDFFCRYF